MQDIFKLEFWVTLLSPVVRKLSRIERVKLQVAKLSRSKRETTIPRKRRNNFRCFGK